jgi:hypothetical protein
MQLVHCREGWWRRGCLLALLQQLLDALPGYGMGGGV